MQIACSPFFLGDSLHSLCVVQNDCIDVLTKDGALFTITLPFPVSMQNPDTAVWEVWLPNISALANISALGRELSCVLGQNT